jgi:hypothetical protein
LWQVVLDGFHAHILARICFCWLVAAVTARLGTHA